MINKVRKSQIETTHRFVRTKHSRQVRSQQYGTEEAFQGTQEVSIGRAGSFNRCQQHLETLVRQQDGCIGVTDVDTGEHGPLWCTVLEDKGRMIFYSHFKYLCAMVLLCIY